MANPRRISNTPSELPTFSLHLPTTLNPPNPNPNSPFFSLSSLIFFLKRPLAFPFLLTGFIFLTWVSLRLQNPNSLSPSLHQQEQQHLPDHDDDANLIRFNSQSSSQIFNDNRGWLLDPVTAAHQAGVSDIDFRKLVNQVPEGATFTMLSDSCHSGGLIDKEKEQIGPSTDRTCGASNHHSLLKYIPYESILHHLASISGINSPEVSVHLSELFGNESSLKFRTFDHSEGTSGLLEHPKPDAGILLSGCQADETSEDANPTGDEAEAYGAFSNAVQEVMKAHEGVLSNREVVARAREILHTEGFEQHPCLYCSDENADAPFLYQPN